MNGAKIELTSLPGLETSQGLFGSLVQQSGPIYNETIVDIMVYLYDVLPPEAFGKSQG
ncbi:hypothetical protein [Erythrobacter sp. YT30]|uniref:hypothetical protein n=1 Tax=Erythrobacter sp. YT30 TaxID=1735012 RepID=UPI000A713E42|nr:hypothetical protein [Erythrobacter sp. YT30]